MSYVVSYDPTQYISATMAEIVETLVIALILVVGITYLFLQDWRATLIPALAIPVSLIGTFAILLPLGFSINVLTMFGLILVIGSLVDDGIIVVEIRCAFWRRRISRRKKPPGRACTRLQAPSSPPRW